MASDTSYWLKQSPSSPLFPDFIWSRPEQRSAAGKLLVVGGHSGGFSAVANAYQAVIKGGVGQATVLLPDSLSRLVGPISLRAEYAPSNSSGGFSTQALAPMVRLGSWSDAVLLAGDFGKNMETAALVEQFISHDNSPLAIGGDSLDFFMTNPLAILNRENCLIGLSLRQLQSLARASKSDLAFTSSLDLLRLVKNLRIFSLRYQVSLLLEFKQTYLVAAGGRISSTVIKKPARLLDKLSIATVWWLQSPSQPFEAISSSLVEPS